MVTPEMLLWLAERMGLWTPRIQMGEVIHAHGDALPRGPKTFEPHRDDAQFARLVVWAALNGLEPMLAKRHAFAGLVGTSSDYTQAHDSTEAGIMAATVVAIARALTVRRHLSHMHK